MFRVGFLAFCLLLVVWIRGVAEKAEAEASDRVTHTVANAWQASDFHDGVNPGCSIGGSGSMPGGRLILGASKSRPDPMNLLIRKTSWEIPAGTPVQVQFKFSSGATVQFAGIGRGQGIQVDVGADQLPAWIHELTASSTLQIYFGGNEPAWSFDLTGTSRVVNAMDDCFRDHAIVGVGKPFGSWSVTDGGLTPGSPTQPFGAFKAPASQPFGAQPPGVGGTPSTEATGGSAQFPSPTLQPPDQERVSTEEASPVGPGRKALVTKDPKQLPEDEVALLAAVEAARIQYRSAANDLTRGAARPLRAQAICRGLASRAAKGWLGKVSRLTTNGEGRGVISVEIAPDTYLKTWNNALSDVEDHTLIDATSPLFQAAAQLHIGQAVRFSALLISDRTDCIREASMTLDGSITEPEFIMRLISIEGIP